MKVTCHYNISVGVRALRPGVLTARHVPEAVDTPLRWVEVGMRPTMYDLGSIDNLMWDSFIEAKLFSQFEPFSRQLIRFYYRIYPGKEGCNES